MVKKITKGKKISFWIDLETYDKLMFLKKESGLGYSELIRLMINEHYYSYSKFMKIYKKCIDINFYKD